MTQRKGEKMMMASPVISVRGERTWKYQPESSRASSRSATDSERPDPLNLTLVGAPAPRCSRPNCKRRERPSQPPNSPICVPSRPRPLSLPIDRIMILKERLTYSSNGSVLNYEPSSGRTSSITSSHPDLSIDLSSINNSDHETETDSDLESDPCPQYKVPERMTHWSGTSSSSATRTPPRRIYPTLPFKDKTSSPSLASTPRRTPNPSRSDSSSRYPYASSRHSESYSSHSRRSADLICVYVDTVKNNDLAKYFRPCPACQKPCCICVEPIDSGRKKNSEKEEPIQERKEGKSYTDRDAENYCSCPLTPDSTTRNVPIEGCKVCNDPFCLCQRELHTPKESIREEDIPECQEPRPKSQASNASELLLERRYPQAPEQSQAADSGNSTLQLDDSERSGSSDKSSNVLSRRHVSLSIMQLSTAAQCARILADSLESVLELAKEELLSNSSARRPIEENVDGLMSALDTLNKTYSASNLESARKGSDWLSSDFGAKSSDGKDGKNTWADGMPSGTPLEFEEGFCNGLEQSLEHLNQIDK